MHSRTASSGTPVLEACARVTIKCRSLRSVLAGTGAGLGFGFPAGFGAANGAYAEASCAVAAVDGRCGGTIRGCAETGRPYRERKSCPAAQAESIASGPITVVDLGGGATLPPWYARGSPAPAGMERVARAGALPGRSIIMDFGLLL